MSPPTLAHPPNRNELWAGWKQRCLRALQTPREELRDGKGSAVLVAPLLGENPASADGKRFGQALLSTPWTADCEDLVSWTVLGTCPSTL